MTTEYRKAPRRKILEIKRIGEWGDTHYSHRLSCGHHENRLRKSPTRSLACMTCFKSQKAEEKIKDISKPFFTELEEEDLYVESEINSTKASIALHFNVSLESVDVISGYSNGSLQIQYAVIFLSPSDIEKTIQQGTNEQR